MQCLLVLIEKHMKKFFTFLLTTGEKGARILITANESCKKRFGTVKVLKSRPVFLWKRTEPEKTTTKRQNDRFARNVKETLKSGNKLFRQNQQTNIIQNTIRRD